MHRLSHWAALSFVPLLALPLPGQNRPSHGTSDVTEQSDADRPQGLLPLRSHGGSLATRAFLSGDWGGVRDQMVENGFPFDLTWIQSLQRITDGGLGAHSEYGGKAELLFNLDLDRMDVMPGGLVTMRTESRYGDSLNQGSGALFPVNDVRPAAFSDACPTSRSHRAPHGRGIAGRTRRRSPTVGRSASRSTSSSSESISTRWSAASPCHATA